MRLNNFTDKHKRKGWNKESGTAKSMLGQKKWSGARRTCQTAANSLALKDKKEKKAKRKRKEKNNHQKNK